jgi:hypothetical protein
MVSVAMPQRGMATDTIFPNFRQQVPVCKIREIAARTAISA